MELKRRTFVTGMAFTAAALLAGCTKKSGGAALESAVKKDLQTAFNGESTATAKYALYAAECEKAGIAFIPWSPLSQNPNEAESASRKSLEAVAARRGIPVPQAALAWLLARSPVMLPIPGTSKRQHLQENVAAAAVNFTADEMREIG